MNLADLKYTREEQDTIEWCLSNLDEEQTADIEEQAIEIASAQINAPEASERLLTILVQAIVRNAKHRGDIL
jgi:hypothetical protein